MPLLKTTQLDQQEGRIALAIQALNQGHFTSIRGTVQLYDIGFGTLRNRIRRRAARYDSRPPNCKLTAIEESTLVE